MKKVSIIIPAYNYARYIGEAVNSALAQSYPDCEVIVVNDGSTDDTKKILELYYDGITVVEQENKGLPAARNAGVRASNGDYICFLDADDMLLPEKIKEEVYWLERDEDLEWVYCDAFLTDEKGVKLKKYSEMFTSQYWEAKRGIVFKTFLKGNFVPVNSPLITRECVVENPFDEDLKSYEDFDFWLRVSRRYKTMYIDKPLCCVRKHGGGMQKDSLNLYWNGIRVVKRLIDRAGLNKEELKMAKELLASFFLQTAEKYYVSGDKKKASEAFKKAIDHNPFSGSGYKGYLKSLLFGKKSSEKK